MPLPFVATDSVTAAARTIQVVLQAVMLIHTGSIVIGMTTRAGGRVSRRRPIHGVRVGIVAFGAGKVAAMIERLVGQAGVAEARRCPTIWGMALTAIHGGIEVSGALAACIGAIVAGRTGAQHLVVIHCGHRCPDNSTVAVLADIGRLHMRRALAGGVGAVVTTGTIVDDVGVVKRCGRPRDRRMAVIAVIAAGYVGRVFASRRAAIMTGAASTDNLDVVDGVSGHPHIRGMTVFADVARLHMCCRILARGVGTVVAAEAVARDVDVIEVRGQPTCGRMTVVAVGAAGDVVQVFSGCRDAVMTRAAGAQDLCVVHGKHGRKYIGRMTVFANVARLHMRRAFACRVSAVVAAKAVAGDVDVIEVRRQPANRRMTVVAVVAAGDVVQVFAGGREPVMTGAAGARHLRMVNEIRGRPDSRVVTVFTHIGGLYVCQTLAGGCSTVVAADAIARDAHMVEVRRPPANRRVTIVTRIAAVYVRRVFSCGYEAVMAGAADAHHLRVVNGKDGRKHVGVVTVFTNIAGLYVGQAFAGSVGAIMTVDTIASDVDVIEIRRQPANRRMTVVAGVAAGDVVRGFPGRREAIMAGAAVAHHLRMVDGVHRGKRITVVAVLADVGC